MTKKTSNKKEKETKINYPVEIEIHRDYLKKIKKSHKNFIGCYDANHFLSCYHFEIKGNEMSVTSTDGNRLLRSQFEIINASNQDISFNIKGYMIHNLVIMKALSEFINVLIEKDTITFNDYCNDFSVTYKLMDASVPFPKTDELIKGYRKRKNYSICVNHSFFNDLKVLESNERTRIIKLNCDLKSNTQAILIDTGSPDFVQTALLMPIMER